MGVSLSSLPPGTETARDVVSCRIFIEGTVLSGEVELLQMTVNKTFNKIAFAKLVFSDGSASEKDFLLSNDTRFKPGNGISVELGYHQETTKVFDGIIIRHGIKIYSSGSVLMIEAKDKAIKLAGSRKSANYSKKKDSAVIGDLIIAKQLQKDVSDTSATHEQLVQFESTDWDFILTRAEANGMLVLTDDGKVIVKQPLIRPPAVMTATFGDNILEFEADMDARRQSKSVKGVSWDFTKQTIEKSRDIPDVPSVGTGITASQLGDIIGSEVTLMHTGYLQHDQVQSWSEAYKLRHKLSRAIGRVRVEGNADVKPGSTITLDGVGDNFNGDVFVSGVLHQFDGNWYTDIQFGWKEDWFYRKEKVMERPAAGLLPGVNGLQIGIVQETDDTKNGDQYRVKVYVATMDPAPTGIWARVAALDAGKAHGVFFRPQKGDEVILGFLNDDPRDPVILGYLHSKSKQESPLPETQGNLEYGIITKEKQKLIFDETNKRITISVDGGKQSIVLNNASKAIELKDDNGNTIKMESSGITIQSDKNVTIKGLKVMIN
jgi:Rhs element Vgr protein